MTADQILALPTHQPWRLFPNASTFKDDARKLRSTWQPDRNKDPKAVSVMAHINVTADNLERQALGVFGATYLSKHVVSGLGECVVLPNSVGWKIDAGSEKFRKNGLEVAGRFRFPTIKLESLKAHLPVFHETSEGVIFVIKSPHQFNLADIRKLGPIPRPHVCWIMTRLYDLACYLGMQNIAHVALTPENLYINAARHTVHLYGGWWYASRYGEKALGAPASTAKLSMEFAKTGIPNRTLTSEQIKATAIHLLGCSSAGELNMRKDLPASFIKWLQQPGKSDPVNEFALWEECLVTSFGRRTFVEWDIKQEDIYG